jgi:hypothetical protein
MQFDYMKWLIYIVYAFGALLIAFLVRAFYVRSQFREMDDSDKLEAPTYEKQESGIKLSDPDEDDP